MTFYVAEAAGQTVCYSYTICHYGQTDEVLVGFDHVDLSLTNCVWGSLLGPAQKVYLPPLAEA